MSSIENLKKPIKAAADFYSQFNRSKQGGFQAREIVDFLDELLQIPDVVSSTEAIKAEWKARTSATIDEVIAYAISQLQIPNPVDKEKTIAALSLVGSLLKAQLAFQKPALPVPNP